MIARVWQGVTPKEKAEEYLRYLEETGVRECRSTAGNQGVYVFRRISSQGAEFLFVSLWDSLDVIHRFAGPDIEKAVYYPADKAFLLELAPGVAHYEVLVAPGT